MQMSNIQMQPSKFNQQKQKQCQSLKQPLSLNTSWADEEMKPVIFKYLENNDNISLHTRMLWK